MKFKELMNEQMNVEYVVHYSKSKNEITARVPAHSITTKIEKYSIDSLDKSGDYMEDKISNMISSVEEEIGEEYYLFKKKILNILHKTTKDINIYIKTGK